MIDLKLVIYIVIAIISVGGAIITFFQMQTKQNMKITQIEIEIDVLKRKQSKSTKHQIQTEKLVSEINIKLEHISKAIDELKRR